MENAAKIVNGAILGMDFKTIVVNGKAYTLYPPTIHKLAGAGYYLSDLGSGETVSDILHTLSSDNAARALSWFIKGDDTLTEELMQGTFDEVVNGLDTAYGMISTENFIRLSGLARNVAILTAKPKP